MRVLLFFAIILIYNADALVHPEVLMTENMQFKPQTNSVIH